MPLLVVAGHEVAGLTRSLGKLDLLRDLGAEPFVCDAFDGAALRGAVVAFEPEAVVNEATTSSGTSRTPITPLAPATKTRIPRICRS